jgi:putative MATE family efflux protein
MKDPSRNPIQNRNQSVLDTDRIGWLLFKLATPAFLGMFVQTLYNVINTIFIGRFVGTEGIAGLSIAFPLQMMAMGLGMMVGIGGLSVISRSIGAGEIDRAERALGNCFTVSVAVSLLLMIIILPFTNFWLRLIGASEAVLPYARPYLIVIIGGSVFNTLAMALLNLVRAEGNARIAMTAMMLGAFLSIILSAVFIIWLKMGVTGAGLATVISQITAMIYLLSYYLTGKSYLKIHVGNFTPDYKILKSMFAIGSASYVQTVATSISSMILLSSVVKYGGDIALSAFGIVQRVMMFANMPAMVIGQGLQPILGFNYGAGRYRLGLKGIYLAYASSTILSAIGFVLVYVFPGQIVSIFRNDPELIEMGIYAARLAFLALPLMGLVMVSQMIFQALGRAVQAFIAAFARSVLFLIPAVLLMSRFWELDGVFLSLPAADTLTFILMILLLSPLINEFRKAAAKEPKDKSVPHVPGPRLDEVGSSRATG